MSGKEVKRLIEQAGVKKGAPSKEKGERDRTVVEKIIKAEIANVEKIIGEICSDLSSIEYSGGQSLALLYKLNRHHLQERLTDVIRWIIIGLIRGFKLEKMFKDSAFEEKHKNSAIVLNLWWNGKGSPKPKGPEMRLSTMLQVFGPLTAIVNEKLFENSTVTSRIYKFSEISHLETPATFAWPGSYVIAMNAESVAQSLGFQTWYIESRARSANNPNAVYYEQINSSWVGRGLETFSVSFIASALAGDWPVSAEGRTFTETEKGEYSNACSANLWAQISRAKVINAEEMKRVAVLSGNY